MEELLLGDLVQMRKTHPCGSDKWTVIRVGADIKLQCLTCGKYLNITRDELKRRVKTTVCANTSAQQTEA